MRVIYDEHNTTRVRCFNADVWSQERQIVHFDGTNAELKRMRIWSNLEGSFASPLAIYNLDANYQCIFDATDYLRTYYAQGASGTLYFAQEADDTPIIPVGTVTVPFTVAGLSDPKNDFIPENCELWRKGIDMGGESLDGMVFPLPFTILQPVNLLDTIGEMRCSQYFGVGELLGQFVNYYDIYTKTVTIPYYVLNIKYYNFDTETYIADCNISPLDDTREYIMLRWVSRYGVIKQFCFERRDVEYSTAETIKFENINNEYDEHKGFEVGFSAVLENLTAYDVWYYSDIINSSEVLAYHNGRWRKVEVTNKSLTVPNSSELEWKKIEIKINFAKYDAI